MSKRQFIMLLGALVIFLPFLGFTFFWKTIISAIIGLLIIGIAYRMIPSAKANNDDKNIGNEKKINEKEPVVEPPFVDHQSSSDNTTSNIK